MAEPRTLVVTDVVDSTALVERLGDERASAVWARHDVEARELLVGWRGREIDRTDGFLLLFEQADDAVGYALAYHRALRALSADLGLACAARVGVHLGPVVLRENPPAHVARGAKPLEVEGLAKPTTARIAALATGGQTLLTTEVVGALARPGRLQSHGHWLLKGVSEPIELFEVGDDDAPFSPPPDAPKAWRVTVQHGTWRPVRACPHRLPGERDAFVGRASERRAIAERFDEGARLVTILGMGGSGKTRLATSYAWSWLGAWPGGAWFCDLSEARDLDGIARAVAVGLDVPLTGGDPLDRLGAALATRGGCLLILDNLEQVARPAVDAIGRWLDRAPDARILVTSREVLGVPGEEVQVLGPMTSEDATALFERRARASDRSFAPDPALPELIGLLDGLPLAIELAAARVRALPTRRILERMTDRFAVLASAGGRRDRHATLRATLDTSWDAATEPEREALAQLSVFEGGFDLDAAAGVLDLAPAASDAEGAVLSLLDRSLVRRVGDERFDMLLTVRDYADAKLRERGGGDAVRARHAAWFARLARRAEPRTGAERQGLERDLDNVLVACRRAIGSGRAELVTPLATVSWRVLSARGPLQVVVELLERALALAALPAPDRAELLMLLGEALAMQGRAHQARDRYTELVAHARAHGLKQAECVGVGGLASIARALGEADAALLGYEEALALARAAGDRRHEGVFLGNLGNVRGDRGEHEVARALQEAALAVHREVGNRRSEALTVGNLGSTLFQLGRRAEGVPQVEAAVALWRALEHRGQTASALTQLGAMLFREGRLEDARRCHTEAVDLLKQVGDRRTEGLAWNNLGIAAGAAGDLDEAEACFQRAIAIHREVGNRRDEAVVLMNLGLAAELRGRPSEATEHLELALRIAQDVRHVGLAGDLERVLARVRA